MRRAAPSTFSSSTHAHTHTEVHGRHDDVVSANKTNIHIKGRTPTRTHAHTRAEQHDT